jgi:hypothetical protein
MEGMLSGFLLGALRLAITLSTRESSVYRPSSQPYTDNGTR